MDKLQQMVGMDKFGPNKSGSSYGRWALEEVLTSYILCRILEGGESIDWLVYSVNS